MKKTGYFYDERSFRLNVLRTTRNNGQDTLQDLNYYYDAVGNITTQQDNAQQTFYFNNAVISPTETYTYDALYRLLMATGRELTNLSIPTDSDFVNNIPCPNPDANAMQNYTHHYQYDELGNMLQMQSQNQWTRDYVYDTSTNRLLKHDINAPNVYSYDTHGNMLTMPHLTSMSWDYLDQLHSATNGTFSSYYNYDAEGNRTRKVVVKGNIVEIRYYIGNYELYQKHVNGSLDFERTTLNISDDEKVFLRIEQKTGENEVIRYQYDNHLGSACLELGNAGQIISYEEYHPFGTTSYRSGRTETEVSLKRYKYCGKERDEETGLYYYGMRYYAAWLCRFVSVDPLQFKYPYYTPYQYAGNKPVSYIDLDGGEEFPNPFDMALRELEGLWNYIGDKIKSIFSSKKKENVKKEDVKKESPQKNSPQKNENSLDVSKIVDNVKFTGNAKQSDVTLYTLNLLSNAAKKANLNEILVSSTKRTLESDINAMYINVERTGLKQQLKDYGPKGDAIFLAYQKAKNSGSTEEQIKEVMMLKAVEVGFVSTHSSPKYEELNAVDIPYVTMGLSVTQQEEFKAAIKEQNSAIIIRVENRVFHLEIPQTVK